MCQSPNLGLGSPFLLQGTESEMQGKTLLEEWDTEQRLAGTGPYALGLMKSSTLHSVMELQLRTRLLDIIPR